MASMKCFVTPIVTMYLVQQSFVSVCFVVCLRRVQAALDLGYGDDSDLTNFVTRPEIRVPLFNVTLHHADKIQPGYWFLGPYHMLTSKHMTENGYYQACQTGPTIYDTYGELVWTGACAYRNRLAMDFRPFERDSMHYLSLFLYHTPEDPKGHGAILDSSYTTVKTVRTSEEGQKFNMHEFNIVEEGTKALHISQQATQIALHGISSVWESGWLADLDIREVDIDSGEVLFKWLASDHINITESNIRPSFLAGPPPKGWNYVHFNSVNKNFDGDYIVSARFTDCIYKISGLDGSILWRLGGTKSSFELEDFVFSRQHDARWLSFDDDTEIISFLDNAADNMDPSYQTGTVSSGLVVELDKRTMKARVLKRYVRPDQQLSRLRGNMQSLPGGNVFLCWSDGGYISEHSADGEVLMEARFASERFVTYRAYKHNFTGLPTEERPVLKAIAHGVTPETSSTVIYTSWNGATEIATWKYYRSELKGTSITIGEVNRTGFETTFYITGYEYEVFAEAIGKDGRILGTTLPCVVDVPKHWTHEEMNSNTPVREHPNEKAQADISQTDSIRSEL